MKQAKAFLKANPSFDLLNTNLHDPQILKKFGLSANKGPMVRKLQALQRIHSFVPNQDLAATLVKKKFDSAHKITSLSKQDFAAAMGKSMKPEAATEVYLAAEKRTNSVMKLWGVVNHLSAPHFKALRANAIPTEVNDYFEGLPGYQDFFGSLNYCDCAECKSIFGPAAYFVDLLRVIDKKIIQQNTGTIAPVMSLDTRRPDLKQIDLTCEKTNETVPYVNIVTDRLEQALSILKQEDLYQYIAQSVYPFNLPFHLPLAFIRNGLGKLNTSLSEILALLDAGKAQVAAEILQISPEKWTLLTEEKKEIADLLKFYDVNDIKQLNELTTFSQKTGLNIHQIENLFNQNLSQDELKAKLNLKFFINKYVRTNVPGINGSKVENLPPTVLDRIHRFIRLANQLNWTFIDLNWAIYALHQDEGDLDSDTLTNIAGIQQIAQQYKLEPSQIFPLLFDLKTIGQGQGPDSEAPFDLVFNPGDQSTYHPKDNDKDPYSNNQTYHDTLKEWDYTQTDNDNQQLATWLAAGTGLREADLKTLVESFGQPPFKLTVGNLSRAYRHARLSQMLHLSVADYLTFLKLFNFDKDAFSVEDLLNIFKTQEVLQRSRLNVQQLDYFVNNVESHAIRSFYQSKQLTSWFEMLKKLIGKLTERLFGKALKRKLLAELAKFLQTDEKVILAILKILNIEINFPFVKDFISGDDAAKEVLNHLSRWMTVIQALQLKVSDLEDMASSKGNFFKSSWPTAAEVLDLFRFKEAQQMLDDTAGDLLNFMSATTTEEQAMVLSGFFTFANKEQLQSLLEGQADDSRIDTLRRVMKIADVYRRTGAGLPFLQSLKKLTDPKSKPEDKSWEAFMTTFENLFGLLRARHTAADWTGLYTQINGEIHARLREAFVALALAELPKTKGLEWIKTERNLYEYLLIDVQMGPQTQISYIKEGLNALQLYLHRCREQLEPGIEKLDIPNEWWEWILNYRIWEANRKIFLYPENYLDPSIRKSKTKIFKDLENSLQQGDLMPETIETAFRKYLESFAELANLVYVDAYYMDDKDVPGCGSPSGVPNSVFFFARTKTQPYKYFYQIKQADAIWSEWKEVNIPIQAKHITPVYAFDRLFLFWVEQKTIKDSNEGTKKMDGNTFQELDKPNKPKIEVTKARIKYTFYNFNKDWVQPQDLVPETPETIISVSGGLEPLDFNGLFEKDFFDTDRLAWNKVYCLKIPAGKSASSKTEQLVVFFGPMLKLVGFNKSTARSSYSELTTDNPHLLELETMLNQAGKNFDKVKAAGYTGKLPVFPPVVLESDLQPNFLADPNEIVFLESDADSKGDFFREEFNDKGQLVLLKTSETIPANYTNQEDEAHFTSLFQTEKGWQGWDLASQYDTAIPVDFASSGKQDYIIIYRPASPSGLGIFHKVGREIVQQNQLNGVIGKFNLQTWYNAFAFDFESTGKLDHLVFNQKSKVISVMKGNKANLTLSEKLNTSALKKKEDDQVFAIDFESTGKTDHLAVFSYGSKTLSFYKKNGETMALVMTWTKVPFGKNDRLFAFDFESTGKADHLAWYGLDSNGFHVFKKAGDEQKSKSVPYSIDWIAYSTQWGVAGYQPFGYYDQIFPFDFDGSGKLDHLVIYRPGAQNIFLILKTTKNKYTGARGYSRDRNFNVVFFSKGTLGGYDLSDGLNRACALDYNSTGKTDHLVLYRPGLRRFSVLAKNYSDVWISEGNDQRKDSVTKIMNHPSAFVYNGDKESFLLLDSNKKTASISQMISEKTSDLVAGLQVVPAQEPPALKDYKFKATRLTTAAVHRLSSTLFAGGIDKLLSIPTQQGPSEAILPYDRFQFNAAMVEAPKTSDGSIVDFDGSYGLYYWELFFHAPHLVFSVLNGKQMYDLSEKWLKYIFDPTATSENGQATNNARFWQFLPFRGHTLKSLQDQLSNENEINAYHCHPFDPHAIARLRIGAYEKAAVMQYIDNLLDCGDQLFRQYSWESITTATMYYVYAWNILGPRPQSVGACKTEKPASYDDLAKRYNNEIPEFLIHLENALPPGMKELPRVPYNGLDVYFCIPENDNFIAYWDRVEDRLFKIRHSMNIDGQKVPLPLFQPPIDPMALARAAGAGVDVMSAFSGGTEIANYYRFQVLLDRARSFTQTVMQFGAALQETLEKKDASALNTFRLNQEKAILNLSTQNFKLQIKEQEYLIKAAEQHQEIAMGRAEWYEKLINSGLNAGEIVNLYSLSAALVPIGSSTFLFGLAPPLHLTPTIFGLADGDLEPGHAVEAIAHFLEGAAKLLETSAEIAAKAGEYERRNQEWTFEYQEAEEEAKQIGFEVEAAEARLEILERQLEVHEKSIAQATEYESFLKNKFTNQELYQWMIGRISSVYYQAYNLALDQALKAQAAYQFELSSDDNFFQFENWDSAHKGLLAGEGLMLSLHQMESAYLQNNVPRMQLEKDISLLHLDPQQFMQFKLGSDPGTLNFSLKQQLFDWDFPSHYDRKIKAVSVTFMGQSLQATAINATLTQNNNTVHTDPARTNKRQDWLKGQSVALSGRQNDAGLFLFDFRYPDEQFYPFEGTGAISTWTLSVPPENNQIDLKDISDIVVKLYYTSLGGGTKAPSLPKPPSSLAKVIDVKRVLGEEKWKNFAATPQGNSFTLELPISAGYIIPDINDVNLVSVGVALNVKDPVSDGSNAFVSLAIGETPPKEIGITNNYGTLTLKQQSISTDKITLSLNKDQLPEPLKDGEKLNVEALENVFIVVEFKSKGV